MTSLPSFSASQHQATIVEQFSQQAVPFACLPAHANAIDSLIGLCRLSGRECMLDVACGPGLVACEFARQVRHVSGVDITPEMIDQARSRQQAGGLTNMDWQVGGIAPLPFDDACFDVVVTRYTFHHFLDPCAALGEMLRVCKPGGTVLVADVVQPTDKAVAYDTMEKLRDPSHVHVLTDKETESLVQEAGVGDVRCLRYYVEGELESQLRASFPHPGDEVKIRRMFDEDLRGDVHCDRMGIAVREHRGRILFSVPILAWAGTKF